MSVLRKILCLSFLFIFLLPDGEIYSQDVPHPLDNKGVYEFLDELAALKIISVNSAVKPYSRLFIAQCLRKAESSGEQLSIRQRKELDFYLRDFGKELKDEKTVKKRIDLFYYSDSVFSLTINPIVGGEMFYNASGRATYWRNGIEARGYIDHWGFYASLRDNHETPLLGKPEYLTQRIGGHIKNGTDWSEMRGGVTYSWKWGNAGLIKDRQQWGNNYNGANIFGGNNPTFVKLRLQLNPVRWFSFNYFHGWLNSMVVDSADSYWVSNSYGTDYRETYHRKYMAANMFTFRPFPYLDISAGNSIVYSDENINPAYLVPLFFYKSVDHSQSSGIDNMNSQMYFDVSSRQIKHLHLYATLFVDEMSAARFTKNDEWNFFSWKTGFRLSDLPVKNLSFTAEFTYTYPLTYQHYVPTLTFESNRFNLGHYLKDNAREWYASVDYRPLRSMDINVFYLDAVRGPDFTEAGGDRLGNPPLSSTSWHNRSYGMKANMQIINDIYVWFNIIHSNITGDRRWSPGYLFGENDTFNGGLTIGF
jgi:hypothetical protein